MCRRQFLLIGSGSSQINRLWPVPVNCFLPEPEAPKKIEGPEQEPQKSGGSATLHDDSIITIVQPTRGRQ